MSPALPSGRRHFCVYQHLQIGYIMKSISEVDNPRLHRIHVFMGLSERAKSSQYMVFGNILVAAGLSTQI
jgi:hypothetical protein